MNSRLEGSALPRSLSSFEKVYLAPCKSGQTGFVTVAIRTSPTDIDFSDHKTDEVKNWAQSLGEMGSDVLAQLTYLQEIQKPQVILDKTVPLIMGIVNVTPDSFSDGGRFHETEMALVHAKSLSDAGADILDIGGESTRPGAEPVTIEEEISRVLPVIEGCREFGPLLSVDTRKSTVMAKAATAGVDILNDVTALEYDADSVSVAAKTGRPVCLMHSAADPKVMQDNPTYDHVVFDVIDYLKQRIEICLQAGIKREDIIVDPGVGFGKTLDHNLSLLKGLRFFHGLGCPVLLGVSRKSFIEKIDRAGDADTRLGGSLSALLYGLAAGVQIFRVHDVAETRQAIAVWQAMEKTTEIP